MALVNAKPTPGQDETRSYSITYKATLQLPAVPSRARSFPWVSNRSHPHEQPGNRKEGNLTFNKQLPHVRHCPRPPDSPMI